jgi:tRNA modification GTPase
LRIDHKAVKPDFMDNHHDTIAALATPVGIGGIGIIKISGPFSRKVAERIFRKQNNINQLLKPYHLHFGAVMDPSSQEVIDEVLLTYMPAPTSYTREDVVEIQCHSGYLILEKILNLVLSHQGVRLAEPGEFTRRAFLNGRIDLTQVEAIVDLIQARTGSALKQAASQLGGILTEKIHGLKKSLISLISHIESAIDFPEEEIGIFSPEDVLEKLKGLEGELKALLLTYEEGKLFREGVKTAIIGKPNVGKSSLLNALLGEERAIISHLPGTTRDTIEESINIFGIPLTIIDTAGLPSYTITDPIEEKGTNRARDKASQADLVLFVLDQSVPFTENDQAIFEEFQRKKMVIVLNKADLPAALNPLSVSPALKNNPVVSISAKYHQGLEELKKVIHGLIIDRKEISSPPVFINRLHHKISLEKATGGISQAIKSLAAGMSQEFIAVDLKCSLDSLGKIVGETTTEEILDQIFAEFCIGK